MHEVARVVFSPDGETLAATGQGLRCNLVRLGVATTSGWSCTATTGGSRPLRYESPL